MDGDSKKKEIRRTVRSVRDVGDALVINRKRKTRIQRAESAVYERKKKTEEEKRRNKCKKEKKKK